MYIYVCVCIYIAHPAPFIPQRARGCSGECAGIHILYVCICIYIYTYIYVCVYICMCICIAHPAPFAPQGARGCSGECAGIHILYVCICICIYIHIYVCVYICVCIYMCVYMYSSPRAVPSAGRAWLQQRRRWTRPWNASPRSPRAGRACDTLMAQGATRAAEVAPIYIYIIYVCIYIHIYLSIYLSICLSI